MSSPGDPAARAAGAVTAPLAVVARPFEGCAVLTLNRPRAMNALSMALRRELVQAVEAVAADGGTQVLVLTGAGAAFCAGLDLKELGASSAAGTSAALAPVEEADPVAALGRFPGVIVGAINGAAITGGFELALACDVLIASPAARFADTHARVGVMPGWGLSQKLPRLVGVARAKHLSFTGEFLDAARAERWGLVSEVVEAGRLLPRALELARDMLAAAPGMLRGYKRVIDDGLALPLGEALALESARSREWAARLDPAGIGARREQVVRRGRAQSGKS